MYKFRTDAIHYKAVDKDGKKNYYVEGYISTSDMDVYNDIVTEEGMQSMLKQINERQITIDYDHEAWRDSNSILPVGKIEEAKIDENGLWVKCKLNPASPKFKNLWGSIKEGFITAFSIAFKPLKTIMKTMGEMEVRLLEDLQLLNVALTGAPVNKAAVLTDFGMKAVMLKSIREFNNTEAINMADEEVQKKSEEVVEEQPQEEVKEEPKAEEAVEEKAEDEAEGEEEKPQEAVEAKSEENVDLVNKLSADLKSLQEKFEKQEAELKSIKEKEVFKATIQAKSEAVKEAEEEPKSVFELIR